MFTYNRSPFVFPKTPLLFAVLWIRICICMDSHQMKGGIRIKKISWLRTRIRIKVINRIQDPDPHQFADDKPQCWNISLFEHVSKVLSLYLEARIRIWIRIKVKSRIWIWIRIKVTGRIPSGSNWQTAHGSASRWCGSATLAVCRYNQCCGSGSSRIGIILADVLSEIL